MCIHTMSIRFDLKTGCDTCGGRAQRTGIEEERRRGDRGTG
jgi:hypothetical protein